MTGRHAALVVHRLDDVARRRVANWGLTVTGILGFAALVAAAWSLGPRPDVATGATVLPTVDRTDVVRRGGSIDPGPLALPTIVPSDAPVWNEDRGPVIVNGRPLPRVTSTPRVTEPPTGAAPVLQVEEVTDSTSSSDSEAAVFAGITVTTSTSATEETTSETSTSTTSTSSSSADPGDLIGDLIDTTTPEPTP